MKTLDEVIKTLEDCEVRGGFFDWKYGISDALHYLKEYKRAKDELDSTRLAYLDVLTDYVALKQWWAESQANPALSWDELRTMEGKPVWYEHEFWKGWIILGKVEQGVNCEMIPDREEKWYIVKDGSAKAYRKERE